MAWSKGETDGAEKAAAKQQRKEDRKERRAEAVREYEQEQERQKRVREARAFQASPAGQAREVHQRGDAIFQITRDLQEITARSAVSEDAKTGRRNQDVSGLLNSIVAEGWVLHSFSTAFAVEGEVSREKLLASGQQTALRGRLMGTYVFIRQPSEVPHAETAAKVAPRSQVRRESTYGLRSPDGG